MSDPNYSGGGRLSVVVPVYNEEGTITNVIERLRRVPFLLEIIVVDDCSTDKTPRLLHQLANEYSELTIIRHEKNKGKTAALKTGFRQTRGEIVIVQDADLEYDPSEIGALIQPIVDGHADVVYGSRFLVRKATRVLYFYHYLANKSITLFSNLLTNVNLTDVETGYKAFRGDIIRNMIVTSRGFGFEIEVTAKVAKLGCAMFEVPISYYGRTYEEGKKISARDGLYALWYIARYNWLTSLRQSYRTLPQTPLRPVPERMVQKAAK